MEKKHKLTPEQEAQLVVALTCLSHCKTVEHAVMKTNVELMGHIIQGDAFDRKAGADRLDEALDMMHELRDELIIYRNIIEDKRTRSQRNTHLMQVRLKRDPQDIPAECRDPKVLIQKMAASIAAKRVQEDEQSS